jgi:hypothetical protein
MDFNYIDEMFFFSLQAYNTLTKRFIKQELIYQNL